MHVEILFILGLLLFMVIPLILAELIIRLVLYGSGRRWKLEWLRHALTKNILWQYFFYHIKPIWNPCVEGPRSAVLGTSFYTEWTKKGNAVCFQWPLFNDFQASSQIYTSKDLIAMSSALHFVFVIDKETADCTCHIVVPIRMRIQTVRTRSRSYAYARATHLWSDYFFYTLNPLLTHTPYGPVRTRMGQINANRCKICFSWTAFSCLK